MKEVLERYGLKTTGMIRRKNPVRIKKRNFTDAENIFVQYLEQILFLKLKNRKI